MLPSAGGALERAGAAARQRGVPTLRRRHHRLRAASGAVRLPPCHCQAVRSTLTRGGQAQPPSTRRRQRYTHVGLAKGPTAAREGKREGRAGSGGVQSGITAAGRGRGQRQQPPARAGGSCRRAVPPPAAAARSVPRRSGRGAPRARSLTLVGPDRHLLPLLVLVRLGRRAGQQRAGQGGAERRSPACPHRGRARRLPDRPLDAAPRVASPCGRVAFKRVAAGELAAGPVLLEARWQAAGDRRGA